MRVGCAYKCMFFLDSGDMGQGGRPEAGEAQPKKFRVSSKVSSRQFTPIVKSIPL